MTPIQPSLVVARAVGRCHGAMFFAVFGGAWLALAAYASESLTVSATTVVAAVVVVFLVTATRLRRLGAEAAAGAVPQDEQRRNDRSFGIVNAVTWISVAGVFQVLPRLGLGIFAVPTVVAIVGLHFFPMPPLYQHRANQVLGACLERAGGLTSGTRRSSQGCERRRS